MKKETIWVIRCVETGKGTSVFGTYEQAVDLAEQMVHGTGNTYVIA